jgi:NADH:ubiquinone oxidoreductase subunit 5 (subunit L)/multisubunit Na+/H+ antiporter MnhA subunit
MLNAQTLLAFIVGAPLITFLFLAGAWLVGEEPNEKLVARTTAATFLSAIAAVILLAIQMYGAGWAPVYVQMGDWFSAGGYTFSLQLLADSLSLPLIGLTIVLSGLIGSFSVRYLHRDRGFYRFFLLLHLFAFGAALAFSAASMDLLIAGWELVGLTSVMLIAFFNERQDPVRNSLRAFAVYRTADVGLLLGVFVLHHVVGSASCSALFRGEWPVQGTVVSGTTATIVGLLFLLAALGKSAQIPFSGWLPRAMEGPTPSSAIFYGGISVHLGVYLLLRSEALLQASPVAPAVIIGIGLLTAIHATLCGRVASDAKTSLAYATLAQVGVIFMEVGFGFGRLALCHVIGHAAVRTLQFLRAPSALHDYHRVHAAAGGHLPKTGQHYDSLMPGAVQRWLYRFALDRCHLDTLTDRLVGLPAIRLAQRLATGERGMEHDHLPAGTRLRVDLAAPDMAGGIDG